jgi:hypothetical protein
MSLNPILSHDRLLSLRPLFLKTLNTIYSSKATLDELEKYDKPSNEDESIIFFRKETDTDSMFKFTHDHYSTPNQKNVSFGNFDMDLDLYINNFLDLCSVYSPDIYFFVDTRLYLDRLFKNALLNKLFPAKVANDNIKIELEIHFNNKLSSAFYLDCQCVDGKMMIQNKHDVHRFFKNFINILKEQYDISDDIDLDYTQPEVKFKESTLLLHMATI